MVSRARVLRLLPVLAAAVAFAGCGDAQPWKGDASTAKPATVAPAATTATNEPPMATTPAQAPSPAGTSSDGSTVGATTPDDASEAVKQDRVAMLALRTTISVVEGCHSGRSTYQQCDEQSELGAPDETGVVIGTGVGEVKLSATPKSIRATTRSKSGARFTVGRSPKGDRFSCQAGPTPGACPDTGTWTW